MKVPFLVATGIAMLAAVMSAVAGIRGSIGLVLLTFVWIGIGIAEAIEEKKQ